ncbi:hypothetical protein HPB51_012851 [Rhipicephalus microplus]|uniref:TRAF-type domain-containing protein n=1 Tax=Rhipicephalus microplus TaxID=6941 RepID=A0A9J6E9C1_RHIMP|nr:hypothetical protein HPB51_012851 [Rhipicephalus microplus]
MKNDCLQALPRCVVMELDSRREGRPWDGISAAAAAFSMEAKLHEAPVLRFRCTQVGKVAAGCVPWIKSRSRKRNARTVTCLPGMECFEVYCWNESHGCQFSGTMEDMLRHYETECTFHLAECLRCGEQSCTRNWPGTTWQNAVSLVLQPALGRPIEI